MKNKITLLLLLFVSIIYSQSDGTIDNTFNSSTGIDETINDLKIDSNGKILVVGQFSNYNSTPAEKIARLNTDGTLDNTFNIGTGPNNNILYSIAIQNDEKIIFGGNFDIFNNISYNRIVRLNPNGTIDSSFNIGTGANASVLVIKILSNGKILVGGTFTEFNGITCGGLIKLNENGSVDTSFNFTELGSTNNISIINSNQILINRFDKLLKLDNDGSIDNTFNSVSGLNIQTLFVQNDNKILIGGFFTEYESVTTNRIARLNSDGTLDTTFNLGGLGADFSIFGSEISNGNEIFVYGQFENYNGISRKRVAKLNNGATLSIQDFSAENKSLIYPIPVENELNIEIESDIIDIVIFNSNGQIVIPKRSINKKINVSNLPEGIYFIEISNNNKKEVLKFIKK